MINLLQKYTMALALRNFFTRRSTDKSRSTSVGFTSPSFPLSVLSRDLSPMALPIPQYQNPLKYLLRKEESLCAGCEHFERIRDVEYCLREKKASKQLFKCSNYTDNTHD